MFGGELGHLLIDRDRIAIRWPQLATSQPDRDAVVMMTECARVM